MVSYSDVLKITSQLIILTLVLVTPSSGWRDPAHGTTLAITSKTTNTFTVNVGITNTGTGGALKFTINNAGTGYTKPRIMVEAPSYSNLPITGVSRRGIGSTTDTGTGVTLTLDVGLRFNNCWYRFYFIPNNQF